MLLLEEETRKPRASKDREAAEHPQRPNARVARRPWTAILAILAFSSVTLTETVAFHLWLRGELFTPSGMLKLALAALLPFSMIAIAVGLSMLVRCIPGLRNKPERSLRLNEKHVLYRRGDRSYPFRWEFVRRWLLHPSPYGAEYETLTLETGSNKKPGRKYYWSMEVQSDQKCALLSELDALRRKHITTPVVLQLNGRLPNRRVSFKGAWMTAFAVWLFVHGFPLLLSGVMPHDPDQKHNQTTSEYSQTEKEKLRRAVFVVARTFDIRSASKWSRLMGMAGGVLTVLAIGIFFLAQRRQRQEQALFDEAYETELRLLESPKAFQKGVGEVAYVA